MPATTSSTDSHKSNGRLGVNPRRAHVKDTERKRVKTACNSCNNRRIKCSGSTPCDQCASAQRACEYPAADKKVFVPQSKLEALETSVDVLKRVVSRLVPDPTQRQDLLTRARLSASGDRATQAIPIKDEDMPFASSPAASVSTVGLSPPYDPVNAHYQLASLFDFSPRRSIGSMDAAATEGSLLQDRDGTKRWLGGTSGATFLDHLKKFMHTLKSSLGYSPMPTEASPGLGFLASRGKYQTSDSRLLFTPTMQDGSSHVMTSSNWSTAVTRLAKVSEYMQDCMSKWGCGGIHYFGDFSVEGWAAAQQKDGGVMSSTPPPRELAFYEAAFALGTVYSLTAANSRRDGQLGEMSFAKARSILGDLTDIRHGMGDVPTLALMATYMAEMNRRDSAYVFLSHALTICCMFGGLKGSFSSERDRRIVWTLFCLEKDASCLMGRPPLYPDEAFQLPYPEPANDLPPPDGLIAHIELSKIAGYIVSNTYFIAPRDSAPRHRDPVDQVTEPLRMLDAWRERLPSRLQIPLELPPELQIPLDDTPVDEGLPTDRALCMLHMKWNQLLILTLRPLFFLAVKSSIGGDFLNSPRDMLDHPGIEPSYIMQCSAAARRNLRLGRHIYERCSAVGAESSHNQLEQQQAGKLVMLDLHHIFNAAVVLLLHQMVFSNVVNTDTIGIRAARAIFENEARTECSTPTSATSGSGSPGLPTGSSTGYASDCLAVLNDLAALVARIRPLRFKGSEHTTTGVDAAGWRSHVSPHMPSRGDGGSVDVGDAIGYSTGTLGNSPVMISDEQIAANLSLENPFGPASLYGGLPLVFNGNGHMDVGVDVGAGYTNQKELERWVHEGQQLCGMTMPLGGYMGV